MINRNAPPIAPSIGAAAFGGLIAGIVTGATLTAASSMRKLKKGEISKKEAGAEIVREAGTMGLATTIGVTATALLGLNGLLSITGVALFTAGSRYAIDSLLEVKSKVSEKDTSQNPTS